MRYPSWRSSATTSAVRASAGGRTGLARNACARERSSQANTSGADPRSSACRSPAAARSAPSAAAPVCRSTLPSRLRRARSRASPSRSSPSMAAGRPSSSASSALASWRSRPTSSAAAGPRRRVTAIRRRASAGRPAAIWARAASSSARSASLRSPHLRSWTASSSAWAATGPGRLPGAANRDRSRISSVKWAQLALPWRRKRLRAATAQRRAALGAPAASAAWARVSSAWARSWSSRSLRKAAMAPSSSAIASLLRPTASRARALSVASTGTHCGAADAVSRKPSSAAANTFSAAGMSPASTSQHPRLCVALAASESCCPAAAIRWHHAKSARARCTLPTFRCRKPRLSSSRASSLTSAWPSSSGTAASNSRSASAIRHVRISSRPRWESRIPRSAGAVISSATASRRSPCSVRPCSASIWARLISSRAATARYSGRSSGWPPLSSHPSSSSPPRR